MSPIASEGIAGPALDDAGVRLNRRLPASLVVGTATAISVVVLLAALAWVALQEQYRAREATMATLTTDAAINAVMKGITDAETGQRGFLLTQREDYLQPFLEARTRLRADMESLLVLMQGDREQLQRAQALRELVLIRLDLLQQVVDLQRADDHEGAVALVAAGRGKQLMDEVRTIAAGMLEAERDRLVFSYAELERSRLRSVWTVFGGLGVLLFLVLVGGLVAAREVRRKQVEDWLRASQASLAAAVQGEHRIEALGEMVLRFMTGQLRAPVAAFHARVAQGRLQRVAGYALAGDSPSDIALGEGLAGECARCGRVMEVAVPAGHLRMESAVVSSAPSWALLVPAGWGGRVNAVLELGLDREPERHELELLERLRGTLGAAVNAALDRSRLEELLDETQRQAEELQAQQEELRVANEELQGLAASP